MTPSTEKAIRKAVNEWAETHGITSEIRRLINLASYDLWFGPIGSVDDDGREWPGFEKSCDLIKAALPHSELWFDTQGERVVEDEPMWREDFPPEVEECINEERHHISTDSDGHCNECHHQECEDFAYYRDDFYHLDSTDVIRNIVGKELVEYVR